MKKRTLITLIIGGLWVFLLIVVLRTPVQWPVHEGLFEQHNTRGASGNRGIG